MLCFEYKVSIEKKVLCFIYHYCAVLQDYFVWPYTVEWLIFPCVNFPNFAFLGVSVSNISEKRTYVFSRF